MLTKLRNSLNWLPGYMLNAALKSNASHTPRDVFFCICDHFEPYFGRAGAATARKRLGKWIDSYPRIVERVRDSEGKWLRYSFFYPEEEYTEADMTMLAELCKAGYGEVEVHLHHDNDNSDNLRKTLLDYKRRLYEVHGLLSIDGWSGEISYGFIHGNWALDNSRRDGRWCGVNDELTILQETGCYADFTMPSAPSETQTRKINSIYYAVDDPNRPKSHDKGTDVRVGKEGEGLLLVQGPLGLNWEERKYGLIPRLEYGGLYPGQPVTRARIACWLKEGVHVQGAPESIFIKLYNHGALDDMIRVFLEEGGLAELLATLRDVCLEKNIKLHFVTAREMANTILAFEAGQTEIRDQIYDFRYLNP